jgi:hypothetical protein
MIRTNTQLILFSLEKIKVRLELMRKPNIIPTSDKGGWLKGLLIFQFQWVEKKK